MWTKFIVRTDKGIIIKELCWEKIINSIEEAGPWWIVDMV